MLARRSLPALAAGLVGVSTAAPTVGHPLPKAAYIPVSPEFLTGDMFQPFSKALAKMGIDKLFNYIDPATSEHRLAVTGPGLPAGFEGTCRLGPGLEAPLKRLDIRIVEHWRTEEGEVRLTVLVPGMNVA